MKKMTCLLSLIALHGIACIVGQEGVPFNNPKHYGEAFVESSRITIDEALAHPMEHADTTVLLEGSIGSVCQNKGCWMYITNGESKIRVTFKDYGFFVPVDSEGKRVRVQGVIQVKVVEEEVLRHWAAEEKGADAESIKGSQTIAMVVASGVLMENGSDLSKEQKESIGME